MINCYKVNSQVSTEERPLQPLAAADNKEEKNSETIDKTRTISEVDESVVIYTEI